LLKVHDAFAARDHSARLAMVLADFAIAPRLARVLPGCHELRLASASSGVVGEGDLFAPVAAMLARADCIILRCR
jgi:hypothetical protein